ncbi:winged helix-turn-helix transcriptional regulator [Amycolatopsis suaedae]|uniref:Transcriptional regulator n=1 Tax=Amycolatopsis suaedae TaxID=2510978 RepID=A0A4Q7JA38_9PSEU|nr:helix-turn-helix domain-containing protein [Amycolatopsis suaedae]RZQ64641.1 transcriptional regulator [Amycolatopsis suaedae]
MGSDVPYRRRVNEAVAVIRGRWTIPVLTALALGEVQYKELLAHINEEESRAKADPDDPPLSDRVLTDTLRRAREHGLIERRAEKRPSERGRFTTTWYRLTPAGRSLLRAVRPLADWAEQYSQRS